MEAIKNIELIPTALNGDKREQPQKYPQLLLRTTQLAFQLLGPIFPNLASKVAYRLFSTPRVRAKHKISDEIIERAKLFEVLYGKSLLKAYEWGKGDKTVLLVHGWESRGTAMRSFVPALVEKGYRVVAFDGPAHGNSDGKRTNLPHFSGAVKAMIRHLDGVDAIIAHSFGGATSVFSLAWDQDAPLLNKLVLIGVPNRMEGVLDNALRTLKAPKIVAKKFKSIIQTKVAVPLKEANVAEAGKRMKLGEALIVHDKQDPVVPFSEAQTTFDQWDNANLLIVDGIGHYRLMKNPEVVKRVVDFVIS